MQTMAMLMHMSAAQRYDSLMDRMIVRPALNLDAITLYFAMLCAPLALCRLLLYMLSRVVLCPLTLLSLRTMSHPLYLCCRGWLRMPSISALLIRIPCQLYKIHNDCAPASKSAPASKRMMTKPLLYVSQLRLAKELIATRSCRSAILHTTTVTSSP